MVQRAYKTTLAFALLTVLAYFSWPKNGFVQPTDCLATYYEACQNGDGAQYLRCLAESFRAKTEKEYKAKELTTLLKQKAVKNWVINDRPKGDLRTSVVFVDEVRRDGITRVRFRLERAGKTWLISEVTPIQQSQPAIPFGTDVRTLSADNPPPDEPVERE
jgi:hypothetical protein